MNQLNFQFKRGPRMVLGYFMLQYKSLDGFMLLFLAFLLQSLKMVGSEPLVLLYKVVIFSSSVY